MSLSCLREDGPWKAAALAAGVYGSFFLLYSGYKKGSQLNKTPVQASFSGEMDVCAQLTDIFGKLTHKSAHRQVNKVVALAGLTLSGAAAIPRSLLWNELPLTREFTLKIGLGSLGVHVVYSVYDYYHASVSKLWEANCKPSHKYETLALVAGSGAMATFAWAAQGLPGLAHTPQLLNSENVGDALVAASVAGMAHFYFIETATGKPQDLPVRPWGYVAFVVPSIAAGAWAAKKANLL
eukprot:TRINITY_DN16631_c0_g1_i1.p1 TRINITY_DN16631_c0_g1~~TRINITY_DN16631_c0_g1_i1.p1  ORF type:complete len:238 (-),score=71.55 TRINITY_DN16631_c0_g1_i1:295-1008(-)